MRRSRRRRTASGAGLCRGDYVRGVQDLFRFLRRADEYLIEADRQLRGGGRPDEQEARRAWYADMDANDEWTGQSAEAHLACVHDIIIYFESQQQYVALFDRRPHRVYGKWQKLDVEPALKDLRKRVMAMEPRITARCPTQ